MQVSRPDNSVGTQAFADDDGSMHIVASECQYCLGFLPLEMLLAVWQFSTGNYYEHLCYLVNDYNVKELIRKLSRWKAILEKEIIFPKGKIVITW